MKIELEVSDLSALEDMEGLVESANKAIPESVYWIGMSLDVGDGLTQDISLGMKVFKVAADLGHTHSQYLHGLDLVHSRYEEQPDGVRDGVDYLKAAASGGHKHAMELLRDIYMKGLFGITADKDLEVHYQIGVDICGEDWVF